MSCSETASESQLEATPLPLPQSGVSILVFFIFSGPQTHQTKRRKTGATEPPSPTRSHEQPPRHAFGCSAHCACHSRSSGRGSEASKGEILGTLRASQMAEPYEDFKNPCGVEDHCSLSAIERHPTLNYPLFGLAHAFWDLPMLSPQRRSIQNPPRKDSQKTRILQSMVEAAPNEAWEPHELDSPGLPA